MTISEYIMAYQSCAINDVPLEDAKRIADEFPTTNRLNDFQAYVDRGLAAKVVHMRFKDGAFYNWLHGGFRYRVGEGYDLQTAVRFNDLGLDEDEIDVSFDILADIL